MGVRCDDAAPKRVGRGGLGKNRHNIKRNNHRGRFSKLKKQGGEKKGKSAGAVGSRHPEKKRRKSNSEAACNQGTGSGAAHKGEWTPSRYITES